MSDATNIPTPATPPADGLPPAATPLTRAALEIDEYVAGLGWDKPARLFALVDSAQLRRTNRRWPSSSDSTTRRPAP